MISLLTYIFLKNWLHKIGCLSTQKACYHAVRTLVLLRIDYVNSLLGGCEADLKQVHRLKKKAAWRVFVCGRDRCSCDLLNFLHWLQVNTETVLKLCCMTVYKCIINFATLHLCDLIQLSFQGQWLNRLSTFENWHWFRSFPDTTRL